MRCVLFRVSVFSNKGPEHMLELVLFLSFVFVVFCLCVYFVLKPKLIHSVEEAIRGKVIQQLLEGHRTWWRHSQEEDQA